MSETIIEVKNLSKRYRIGAKEEDYKTFREAIIDSLAAPIRNFNRLRKLTKFESIECKEQSAKSKESNSMASVPRLITSSQDDVIWALRDVSFEVKQGEVVGIIGRNGAGKSTLLKILSRITEPTTGDVKIYGRISSLLEVGTGFHPELTGRENIYLNGAILGMRKTEIARKFDEIVDFAEIEKFIDTPVKRYSSGMYVRLAFAVAAHLEPEILLVDEVLAVGDAAFQKKCLGKMEGVSRGGRTILFVSHNMAQINKLCPRAILLNDGVIKRDGPSSVVVDEYVRSSNWELVAQSTGQILTSKDGSVILQSFKVYGEEEQKPLRTGEPCHIELEFYFAKSIRDPSFVVSVRTLQDVEVMRQSTFPMSGISTGECSGCVQCTLRIDKLLLAGGSYVLAVGLGIPKVTFLIPITEIGRFEVLPTDYYDSGHNLVSSKGFMVAEHTWAVERVS